MESERHSVSLRGHLRDEKIHAGRVAARPGKAGDETQLDRVFADAEDDRDRRGCSFGRKRGRIAAGRSDHGHATADEVGHERRQTIVSAVQPLVLHRHVLTLNVARLAEALPERGRDARGGIGGPEADEADDRHCRLLRARRERPRQQQTATPPKSMALDPVGSGIVESLSRPGGNTTGFMQFDAHQLPPVSIMDFIRDRLSHS